MVVDLLRLTDRQSPQAAMERPSHRQVTDLRDHHLLTEPLHHPAHMERHPPAMELQNHQTPTAHRLPQALTAHRLRAMELQNLPVLTVRQLDHQRPATEYQPGHLLLMVHQSPHLLMVHQSRQTPTVHLLRLVHMELHPQATAPRPHLPHTVHHLQVMGPQLHLVHMGHHPQAMAPPLLQVLMELQHHLAHTALLHQAMVVVVSVVVEVGSEAVALVEVVLEAVDRHLATEPQQFQHLRQTTDHLLPHTVHLLAAMEHQARDTHLVDPVVFPLAATAPAVFLRAALMDILRVDMVLPLEAIVQGASLLLDLEVTPPADPVVTRTAVPVATHPAVPEATHPVDRAVTRPAARVTRPVAQGDTLPVVQVAIAPVAVIPAESLPPSAKATTLMADTFTKPVV